MLNRLAVDFQLALTQHVGIYAAACLERRVESGDFMIFTSSSLSFLRNLTALLACNFLLLLMPVQAMAQPQDFDALAAWDPGEQGAFVTSLARDSQGRIYAGTEDSGVWRLDADGGSKQFTSKNGLASNRVYAIACDQQDRVWVGTQNGLSVIASDADRQNMIRSYGVLDGVSGERVFAIAVSPTDGDVWIGTNAGLTRYMQASDSWKNITRDDGLPANDVCALAFDTKGRFFIGTQAEGLAVASARDNYQSYRPVTFEKDLPLVPVAVGKTSLPTGFINAIHVLKNGTVCVATTNGLARSHDGGANWDWSRGNNWAEKVRGLLSGAPPGWSEKPGATLAEDYVTALAEDDQGDLWLGYRRSGVEVLGTDGQILYRSRDDANGGLSNGHDFARSILSLPDGTALIAWYGGGLTKTGGLSGKKASAVAINSSSARKLSSSKALPSPAAVPSLADLNALLASLAHIKSLADDMQPSVVSLPDDWTSGGTHLGRYGRYWMCLCAVSPPAVGGNYIWGAGTRPVEYAMGIGPNFDGADTLRYWVSSLQTSEPRSLELPSIYFDSRVLLGYANAWEDRRQAEVDDHGETYSTNRDGPNIFVNVRVPTGLFTLSLYDFNKDGHNDVNRFRDYGVSIRPHPKPKNGSLTRSDDFPSQPELARGRIRDFWGGVWKRFQVRGPQELTIEVSRNYSHNTILAAVTLDLVDEEPPPYFRSIEKWQALEEERAKQREALANESPKQRPGRFKPGSNAKEAADRLFIELQHARLTNASWWSGQSRPFYAALGRWYEQQRKAARTDRVVLEKLGTCYYQLGLLEDWEACQKDRGLWTARDVEKSLRWDGVPGDERTRGYYYVTEFLKLKEGLGVLALDPKNIEAEQERRASIAKKRLEEEAQFEPPTADQVDKDGVLKLGVQLKRRPLEKAADK